MQHITREPLDAPTFSDANYSQKQNAKYTSTQAQRGLSPRHSDSAEIAVGPAGGFWNKANMVMHFSPERCGSDKPRFHPSSQLYTCSTPLTGPAGLPWTDTGTGAAGLRQPLQSRKHSLLAQMCPELNC